MPVHRITAEWSGPIALHAGDVLQTHGSGDMEIVHVDHSGDAARLLLPRTVPLRIEAVTTIRAKAPHGEQDLHIIRGLSSAFGFGTGPGPGVPSTPAVAMTLMPAGPIPADAPAGTVVASITGLAPPHAALSLTGADAALLAISGGQIVTAAALTGRASVLVSVAASASGYTPATRSAAVTVQAVTPPDPETILVTNPDATMTVATVGPDEVTVTITAPPEYAGAYALDPADLAGGPAALVPVEVTGDAVVGATLTAAPALWVHDGDAGDLTVTRQWHDGATPIPGATGLTYVRASGSESLRYIETATDDNGTRTSIAEAEPAVAPGLLPDTFSAPDGTLLSAYVGESGIGWRTSDNRAVVEAGALRSINGPGGMRLQERLDSIGADQWAEATMVVLGANERMGLGVRIGGDRDGYFVDMVPTVAWVRKIVAGTVTGVSAGIAITGLSDGSECQVRLEVQGTTLRLFVNGTQRWTGTDTSHATGRPGIAANGGIANRSGSYPATFHAGAI